jgi:hypothetical protein
MKTLCKIEKKDLANRFALIALICLSLFASTSAFAGNTQTTQQVVVTNSPAQPVPMVGLVKDSDAPARKPFQTALIGIDVVGYGAQVTWPVVTVPANQRLVIEYVSGNCAASDGSAGLQSTNGGSITGFEYLPSTLFNSGTLSSQVKFYANPGEQFGIWIRNGDDTFGGYCYVSVTGYYVNLP